MAEVLGDSAVYRACTDAQCPAHREGYGHAHLMEVQREGKTVRVPTADGQYEIVFEQ